MEEFVQTTRISTLKNNGVLRTMLVPAGNKFPAPVGFPVPGGKRKWKTTLSGKPTSCRSENIHFVSQLYNKGVLRTKYSDIDYSHNGNNS